MQKKYQGFTLIEVLIVVTIVALLSVTALVTLSKQRTKAEDAGMKTDLARLKIAFEDYYNDHNCYPPTAGEELKPYLDKIPFNKKTGSPYILEKDTTGCGWFKIYTTLSNQNDPQAVGLRTTDPSLGSTLGNYGVSSANTVVSIFYNPGGSTIPTPSNHYYCSGTAGTGGCTSFDTTRFTCSPSYSDPNCGGGCTIAGSCSPIN